MDEIRHGGTDTDGVAALRVAVLASGNGSNLQAIIDAIGGGSLKAARIVAVLSDKPGCRALERAESARIATRVFPVEEFDGGGVRGGDGVGGELSDAAARKGDADHAGSGTANAAARDGANKANTARERRDLAMVKHLRTLRVDLVVLAGYMQILSSPFIDAFAGRIINVHPSLLPKFPGLNAIEQALDAQVAQTGVTVHYVDHGIDTGPVIAQEDVPIEPGDTPETLAVRIHAVEHRLLPAVISKIAAQAGGDAR